MSSIVEQPQPSIPSGNHYTCLACNVIFPTSELQRDHYRTDWHKYNLKRKIADLIPVSAEQFAEKLLATQMKGQEEQNRMHLVYECMTCRKSYSSENAFHNHVQSKKHKDIEELQTNQQEEEDEDDGDDNGKISSSTVIPATRINTITDAVIQCLFCSHPSADFDANLGHMRLEHGFFLPDKEYLEDPEGLVKYLAQKIANSICLYCNGRGKDWKSMEAVRTHMIAVGHCKMAYDESEDPDDLLKYYDFGSLDATPASTTNKEPEQHGDELVLENGVRIANRHSFRQYYRQQHRLKKETHDVPQDRAEDTIASLSRRERRHPHQLAITDSGAEKQKEHYAQTGQGIKAAAAQLYEDQRYATNHNVNTLKRFRTQNPI